MAQLWIVRLLLSVYENIVHHHFGVSSGCCASSRQSASLTGARAKSLAIRLANAKAFALYQCQPFRDGQPAHFVDGRWVWTHEQGYGSGDIEATVELAADGSTRSVDVQLLDSKSPILF